MKSLHNILLTACVAMLALICYLGISGPLTFDGSRARRESAVKDRLLKIRSAEEQFKQDKGIYAGRFEDLIQGGYLADTLRYIPYSDGESFHLRAASLKSRDGQPAPVMECGAEYQQYLQGLDHHMIDQLISTAVDMGEYPGLKIGDVSKDIHNRGNWE